MHEVVFIDKTKQVASTWDELSREQVRRLLPILYGNYPDANQQRIEVLEVLLGVSRPLLLRLTSVQLLGIFWLTDFLLVEPVTRTKQVLPIVKRARLSPPYYGPADELSNSCFLEFAFADAYFVAYANTGEAQWLDQLVATLYRRPRRMAEGLAVGDRRLAFNENLIEVEAARLARLPQLTKLAICTWYRGCRHALEQRYPHVFTAAGEQQEQGHPDGWGYVLREMSGQAFGNYTDTSRQLAHQVLAKMNDDLARAEELKRQQAQQAAN